MTEAGSAENVRRKFAAKYQGLALGFAGDVDFFISE